MLGKTTWTRNDGSQNKLPNVFVSCKFFSLRNPFFQNYIRRTQPLLSVCLRCCFHQMFSRAKRPLLPPSSRSSQVSEMLDCCIILPSRQMCLLLCLAAVSSSSTGWPPASASDILDWSCPTTPTPPPHSCTFFPVARCLVCHPYLATCVFSFQPAVIRSSSCQGAGHLKWVLIDPKQYVCFQNSAFLTNPLHT